MDSVLLYVALAFVVLLIAAVVVVALRRGAGRPGAVETKPRPGIDYAPGVGDDDSVPRDTPRRTVDVIEVGEPLAGRGRRRSCAEATAEELTAEDLEALLEVEVPEPAAGRLQRLRARLARSQNALGRGLLALLSREDIDEDTWDEVEEILLTADLGVAPTQELIERLRTRVRVEGTSDPVNVRTDAPRGADRARRPDDGPARPCRARRRPAGRRARGRGQRHRQDDHDRQAGPPGRGVRADGRPRRGRHVPRRRRRSSCRPGGTGSGAAVVRGPEGGDPAAVAFDAVATGMAADVDTVIIDTAGRLHTKTGLMDELGKVKRVIEKQSPIDEVLLVLDATTGQNGLVQARVFAEVVDVTGIVLTKLDGTARGGIVVAVQRELGVPVKLVGLGEGPDDLAPFEPEVFVDALIED